MLKLNNNKMVFNGLGYNQYIFLRNAYYQFREIIEKNCQLKHEVSSLFIIFRIFYKFSVAVTCPSIEH